MEIRKVITGYNDYYVSNFWKIKSLKHWKEKLLKLSAEKDWYLRVGLCKENNCKTLKVHRIVLKEFVWQSELQCNHIDWDKTNNNIDNLEYVTNSENQKHKYSVLGHICKTRKSVIQLNKEWEFIKVWPYITLAAQITWISRSNIIKVCKWKSKTAGWYIWKYKN